MDDETQDFPELTAMITRLHKEHGAELVVYLQEVVNHYQEFYGMLLEVDEEVDRIMSEDDKE